MKLDENLGILGALVLTAAGHDVATVAEEGLTSQPDAYVIQVCRTEARCLVTLDKDFCNVKAYPPSDYTGIAVLRLPSPHTASDVDREMSALCGALARANIVGKLWVVKGGKIRAYLPRA